MSERILKRSKDKMIAGVCAGLAEYVGWRPSQMRLLFILVLILGGASLWAYIILLFVMPPPDA